MVFNDFYWHDAVIKNIVIDRSNPGILDIIVFDVEFAEIKDVVKVQFENVYYANMNLNFGIVAEESILDAVEMKGGKDFLLNISPSLYEVIKDVELNTYDFKLNSTGGVIKIISSNIDFNMKYEFQ